MRRGFSFALLAVGAGFTGSLWLRVDETENPLSRARSAGASADRAVRTDALGDGGPAPADPDWGEFVASDPVAAVRALADVRDPVERRRRVRVALKHWAETAPEFAAGYALGLGEGEWQTALAAVFEGAAAQEDEALALARSLCRAHPERADEYGRIAITAFAAMRADATAVRFAVEDTSVHHDEWLQRACYLWATAEPEAAFETISRLPQPSDRRIAFEGLVAGWSATSPAAVAALAVALPSGPERTHALREALPQWVSRDPKAAAAWLQDFAPTEEFDPGIAALACSGEFARSAPEVALRWAARLVNPTLRANTLHALASDLAASNPAAARGIIALAPGLSAAEISALLDGMNHGPDA